MRNAFADEITQLAARDPRVVLLSGDIGNRLFNPFKESFGDRFINCGIAEQNMVSVAAGLAMGGMRPVVYTIAPFVTARCLEQIRIDLGYHRQPVVVVGVGAGLSYANLGATHETLDDLAMLRAIPGLTIVCPGDAMEVRGLLRASLAHDGPVYLRLGKKGEPVVHESVPDIAIIRALDVRRGDDVCLLSVGNVLPIVVQATDLLVERGISPRVVSLHTVKPLDEAILRDVFAQHVVVATVEEHSVVGGAGGAVAEWLIDQPTPASARLLRIGCDDRYLCEAGGQSHARERYGLTPASIAQRVEAAYRHARPLTMTEWVAS